MIFSKPVKSSSMKWSMWMPVTLSKVFQVQTGPPKSRAALISSSSPGSACCPVVPSTAGQLMTGTMVSRGMLITVTSWLPGEMCSSIRVSERLPGVLAAFPPMPP
jgi:hypothetical protein